VLLDEEPRLEEFGQGWVDGVVVDPDAGLVVAVEPVDVELDEELTAAWVKMLEDAAVALVAAEATP
jgi:hypothetical protein